MLLNPAIRCICFGAIVSLVGCGPTKSPEPEEKKDNFPATPTSMFEGATTFPYTASKTKQDLVLAGYKTLREGMTIEFVQKILGVPDFSESYERSSSPKVAGHVLTYYLFRK